MSAPGGGDRGLGGLSSHTAATPGEEHPSLPRHSQEVRNNQPALCLQGDIWYYDFDYVLPQLGYHNVYIIHMHTHTNNIGRGRSVGLSVREITPTKSHSKLRQLLPPLEYIYSKCSYFKGILLKC